MRYPRTRRLFRFVSMLAILIFTGCGSLGSNVPRDRIVIRFWHGMGGPLGKILNDLITEYNQIQPVYYIDGICMGSYDTLEKKILASVVARRSPDISQNFEALTLKLSRAGKLACLDTLIEREPDPEAFKNDIIPVMLQNNTFDGKLWSFPFNKSVPVLYYNRNMFQANGLNPDEPPRTIDQLWEYSRKLTRDVDGDGKYDIHGFAFTLRNQWNWACRHLSYGGTVLNEFSRTVFLNDPAAVRATRSYSDMLREGTARFAAGYDHQNDWLAGRVAMFEASIVSRVYLQDKIKFNHGVAPVPYGNNPVVIISGTNINIFDNGDPEKIEGAWNFIKWFTSPETGARWSMKSTYMPVRKSSLELLRQTSEFNSDRNFAAPYEQLEYATFDPRIPEWFECRIKISDELEQIYIKTTEMREKQKSQREYLEMITTHMNHMQTTVTGILENSLDSRF
ncbi:ABC transporter substrate-binding protein [bacterium]|nr:ABC transporter substrate-binding protein [candidate division CSSED10-310 bacterium]